MSHTYTWNDVHSRPAAELAVGNIIVTPGVGTAYHASTDGQDVRGVGWLPLDGTAWTVIDRNGNEVRAVSDDARDVTGSIPEARHVLVVKPDVRERQEKR